MKRVWDLIFRRDTQWGYDADPFGHGFTKTTCPSIVVGVYLLVMAPDVWCLALTWPKKKSTARLRRRAVFTAKVHMGP